MKLWEVLAKILDLPEDIETNISDIEYDGKSITFKVAKKSRATKVSKEQVKENLRTRVENGEENFNFKDLSYIFEMYMHDMGKPYTSNIARDTVQIKKVFPNKKTFGMEEVEIVKTYIEIFDAVVATPTYKSATWGGLVYAMPKVKKAIAVRRAKAIRSGEIELTGEVF